MAEAITTDVAVVGGGPGGYVAAIRASQLGLKTVLVERDRLGGVCLNWGCIPSKALLRSAEMVHLMKRGAEFGVLADNVRIDFPRIIQRSREAADRLSKGVRFLMKKHDVQVVSGTGKLVDGTTVAVRESGMAGDTETARIAAGHVILSTGARPRDLPGITIDRERVITAAEAMTLPAVPEKLVIIGGGAIGVEFAYFYNALGTAVTILEMEPHLLPLEDEEVARVVERSFKKSGITVLTQAAVDQVTPGETGVTVAYTREGQPGILTGDRALVAVGVTGNTEGLAEVGVAVERSFITVDRVCRTALPTVYAIGDCNGPPLLAHVASAEGVTAAEAIAGRNPAGVDYDNIPACTYCQPQVASVGLTEAWARAEGFEVKIGKFPFSASGKAIAVGETAGLVKVVVDAKYGEILGAHIVGHDATDLIAEVGVARTLESTPAEILRTVHAHPTLSEAVMEAMGDALGEAIHI